MLYYNITFNIEPAIQNTWLAYQKQVFIPALMATKVVQNHKLLHLLTEIDNGAITYALQLCFADTEDFMGFEMTYLPQIFGELDQQFKGRYLHFNTLLEEI